MSILLPQRRLWRRKEHVPVHGRPITGNTGLHAVCTRYGMRFVSYTQSKVPEKLLKSAIGHSESMDTCGIYGHQIDGELQKAAGHLDIVF